MKVLKFGGTSVANSQNIKLVLAVIILAWAVFEFTKGHIMNGISIVLLAGIFVFFYFKNEILLLTFFKFHYFINAFIN